MAEHLYAYFLALVPLLVAVDPLGAVPIYVAATAHVSEDARLRVYLRSVIAAALIALAFAMVGKGVFALLGIAVADFQIAAGLMLVAIALYEIVLVQNRPAGPVDPSIVPLAMPLTVGPAVMTVTLELVQSRGLPITCLALITVLGILLVLLLASRLLLKIVSLEALHAFAKIVYILLAAIGVHYIRVGLTAVMHPASGAGPAG